MTTIRAVLDRVIVEREDHQGTIQLVGHKEHRGRVLAVGPGRWKQTAEGKELFFPTSLKPGDRVIFSHRAGMETEVEGQQLLVMREDDVMCVIEDDAEVGLSENWAPEKSQTVASLNFRT
jgi:chaperonin GroES